MGRSPTTPNADVQCRLDALDRLNAMFWLDRMLFLVLTATSFFVLIGSGVYTIVENAGNSKPILIALFGSGGMVSASAGLLITMWSRAIKIVFGASK